MKTIEWSVTGPHFANCNCDYGCPCQFMALPTKGTCEAVTAWRIDEGYFDETVLDGLNSVTVYAWPGPVHEGNGTMQVVVDERANTAQREALVSILQGEHAEEGTTMLSIYRAMCTRVLEPLFKRIDLSIDVEKRTAQLSVPGYVRSKVEPLRNPVTGDAHRARIGLPDGLEFREAEVASGTSEVLEGVPMEFTNSHAHLADGRLTSRGFQA